MPGPWVVSSKQLRHGRREKRYSVGVVLPGLVFGFFRDRYGNLYAPIALHIFYNSGLIWLFRVWSLMRAWPTAIGR